MGQAERSTLPFLMRPDLIDEVNRMAAHFRSPEGQAEIAAWPEASSESEDERRLSDDWQSIADTSGWEWNGEL
jgi:hypothetical protein